MKNVFKLLVFISLLFVFLFTFAVFSYAEFISGHIEQIYQGNRIVNNDWNLDTDSGTLTIKSLEDNKWNETGTGQNGFEGSWYEHKSKIKKVILDGNFQKISNNAFSGCTNLLEIEISESVTQIDHNAFSNCLSLHSIYFGSEIRYSGMAYLPNINTISAEILKNTAIRSVFLSPNISSINDTAFPAELTKIYGTRGTLAESFASSKGLVFKDVSETPSVNIYIDGSLNKSYKVFDNERFTKLFFELNGKIYTIFEDKGCKIPYDNSQLIESSIDIYAKPIMSFSGWSVRVAEYKGLRSIFEYVDIEPGGSIKITEVGAIAAHTAYALDEFKMENRPVTKIPLYEDGALVNPLLSSSGNDEQTFAITVIGFEGTEEKFAERALKNTVFRGYITVFDESNNTSYTYYTDAVGNSLRAASEDYLNRFPNTNKKYYDFIEETLIATESYCNEVKYNKYQLFDLLTEVYNDNGKLIVGEQIDYLQMPHDVLDRFYEETGEYPSILGMDLGVYGMDLSRQNYRSEPYRDKFIKELVDYCRSGGIITVSSHFKNPMDPSQSCRGHLGKDAEFKALITEGTELNAIFKQELDCNAEFLRLLANNSIPVLWRPFHEMNGNWFWWCIKQENNHLISADSFRDLWIYVYDYYVNTLGLTNLIWVFSPNCGNYDPSYCYPGDEYVDMTGLDWYSNGKYEISDSYNKIMSFDMPVALTEYGSNQTLDSLESYADFRRMYDEGMKQTYVLTWTMGSKQDFINAGRAAEFMAMPDTLSRSELFELFRRNAYTDSFGDDLYFKITRNLTPDTYTLEFYGSGNDISNIYASGKTPWSYYSDRITDIIFPESIEYIGADVFTDLTDLKTIAVKNKDAIIDSRAFTSDELSLVYGFYGSTAQNFAVESNFAFANINDILPIATGYLYEEWKDSPVVSTVWYYDKATQTLYFVSDKSGWNETGNLSYATDDLGWKEYKDEIKKVVVGEGLNKVSQHAFENHTALEIIELSQSIYQMDDYSFSGCSSLDTVYVRGNVPIKGVADLHNVTTIDAQANLFIGCSFDTVIFNNEETSINPGAFSGTPIARVIGNSGNTAVFAQQLGASAVSGYVDDSTVWTIENNTLTVYTRGVPTAVDAWSAYSDSVTRIVFEKESSMKNLTTGVFDIFSKLNEVLFKCEAPNKYFEKCFGSNNITIYFEENIKSFSAPLWNGYNCRRQGSTD